MSSDYARRRLYTVEVLWSGAWIRYMEMTDPDRADAYALATAEKMGRQTRVMEDGSDAPRVHYLPMSNG